MTAPTLKTGSAFVADAAERVLSTFLQVFLATVLAVDTGVHVGWIDAAAIAGFAAVASLLTTVLVWMVAFKAIANPYVDLLYRGVITFGQTLLAYVTAAQGMSLLVFHWDKALEASLVAAGVAVLKGLIGLNNAATLGVSAIVLRPDFTERARTTKLPLVA